VRDMEDPLKITNGTYIVISGSVVMQFARKITPQFILI
jgi:hypothetical protein